MIKYKTMKNKKILNPIKLINKIYINNNKMPNLLKINNKTIKNKKILNLRKKTNKFNLLNNSKLNQMISKN
jgi:hypothetical protein